MKANLKRVLSLLLVAVMLLSSFSGFGTLTAGAEQGAHFTLLNPDKHNYLHVTRTKDLQLDLYGRGGTVGAISWELVDANDNPLTGKLYSVSTSSAAQALNTSGDIITLDGAALKAALYPGEDFPTDGVKFTVHCYEAGNTVAGHTELTITLVDDHFYPVDDFPKPQRTHYLVGATHDDHGDLLYGDFRVWVRNADFPAGQVLDADITGVYTTAHHAPDGNTVSGDVFTFERVGDEVWNFQALQPGSTEFTVTFEDEAGVEGNYSFTLNAVEGTFELVPHFSHGSTDVLRNGTLDFDVAVRYCFLNNGQMESANVDVDNFTLTATSAHSQISEIEVMRNFVRVTAADETGPAPLVLTAAGTHNGQSFTVTNPNFCIDVMDHYFLLQFEGLNVNVPVGESVDLFAPDGPLKYMEYSYDSTTGASVVDRSANTTWTVRDENGVFVTDTTGTLPIVTRVSPDSTVVYVKAEYKYELDGEIHTATSEQQFGVNSVQPSYRLDYQFPTNRTETSSPIYRTHRIKPAYAFETDYPHLSNSMVNVTNVEVANVRGGNTPVVEATEAGWQITLEPGFEGSYDTVLHYTDVLTGEPATYTFTVTLQPEVWSVDFDFVTQNLLPGETRSFEATPMVTYINENGHEEFGTSTEGAAIKWVTPAIDGVTFHGTETDTLTIQAGTNANGSTFNVTAQVWVDGVLKAEAPLDIQILSKDKDYVLIDYIGSLRSLELGESVTFTPSATLYFINEAGQFTYKELAAADGMVWKFKSNDTRNAHSLSIKAGEADAKDDTVYDAGTVFTITRTAIPPYGVTFTGYWGSRECGSFTMNLDQVPHEVTFRSGNYTLNPGDTLNLLDELVYDPTDLPQYLPGIEWRLYENENNVVSVDEASDILTANTYGTVRVSIQVPGISQYGDCVVRVVDPFDGMEFSVDWVGREDGKSDLYTGEYLEIPLDTGSILDANGQLLTGLTLEVDAGYPMQTDDGEEFASLGSSMLTATENGYKINGAMLGEIVTAMNLRPEEPSQPFTFMLRAAVYRTNANGERIIVAHDVTACELRFPRIDFPFEPDSVEIKPAWDNTYGISPEYEYVVYNADYPEGKRDVLTLESVEASDTRIKVLYEYVEQAGCYQWNVHVPKGFTGDFTVTYTYKNPLTGNDATHVRHFSFVDEIWYLDLFVDNSEMLPGEARTVNAHIQGLVYNEENGTADGDTSDFTVVWEVEEFTGVSSTVDAANNAVTVSTTAETGVDNTISVTAKLMRGNVQLAQSLMHLRTRDSYYTITPNVLEEPAVGETVTVTPKAFYHYLDGDGNHASSELPANETYGFFTYWLSGMDVTADGASAENSFGAADAGDYSTATVYPLGTTFRYTRSTFGKTGVAITLRCLDRNEEGDPMYEAPAQVYVECSRIDVNIGFTNGSYDLYPGQTLNMSDLLETDPAYAADYLAGGEWSTEGFVSLTMDENGDAILTAHEIGEGVVCFTMANADLNLYTQAECQINVLDPNGEGPDAGGLVNLGAPDYGYMYENQSLTLPLDANALYDSGLTLALGVEYTNNGEVVPLTLVEGTLTELYDTEGEDPTRVIGVAVDGEKLHASLKQAIGTFDARSVYLFAYAIDENGDVVGKDYVEIELRRTRVDYYLDDGTCMTDLNEQTIELKKKLEGQLYRGNAGHADGDPDAYGTKVTTTITDAVIEVLSGDASAVRLEATAGGWNLIVGGGYLGAVKFTLTYTDNLTGEETTDSVVLTFVDEEYYLRLEPVGQEWSLLPGETRTFKAVIMHYTVDPVEGVICDNTLGSGVTLRWEFDNTLPGVTYRVSGNTLTVTTTAAAKALLEGDSQIDVYAEIAKNGSVLANAGGTLYLATDYCTIDPAGFETVSEMNLGEDKTFTPKLIYMWLDTDDSINRMDVTADDTNIQWYVRIPSEYSAVNGLSVNGVTVQPDEAFPLGTTFTYTHRFTGGFDFALEAAFPGDDATQADYGFSINTAGDVFLDINSTSYILEPGDTLDLMGQLVYAPSNLLEYLGNLSWSVSNTAVATVADGVLTANAAGTAIVTLYSDLPGTPEEVLFFTVVVPVISDAHEDPAAKLPVVDTTTPVTTVTPVKKNDEDTATQDAVLAETKDLVEKVAGALATDDDAAAEEVAAIIEPAAGTTAEEAVEALANALVTGATITTKLNVVELDEADTDVLPTENREKIEDVVADKLGDAADAVFFDTTLQVHVDGTHIGNKTETKAPVEITIAVPDTLRDDTFRYTVFRLHDGSVEALDTELDPVNWVVTFESHLFSTYALGFSYDCERLGHDFTVYAPHTDATCTANATERAVCDNGCGKEDIREVANTKLGHSFVTYRNDNNATCTADATKTSVCERGCGTKDVLTVSGTKLAHSFGAYTADGNATCNADGTKTAKCVYGCGTADTVADAGSKLEHKFTNYVADGNATCTKAGTKTAKCAHGCGLTDTVADETLAEHKFSEYVSNNDATCDFDGTKTAKCDFGCGTEDTVTDAGTKLEHSFTAYTENADGTKTASCDHGCGATDVQAAEESTPADSQTDAPADAEEKSSVGIIAAVAIPLIVLIVLAIVLFLRKKKTPVA